MMVTNVAVLARTNIPVESIRKDFLSQITEYMAFLFASEAKNVVVELNTDVAMMRGGSSAPMMNINLYHNSDTVNQTTKAQYATSIAQFMSEQIQLPVDRVLVLFFDTRKCT